MKKFFAALAVLTVAFGTALSALPANASTTYVSTPNPYEGANN